jgi:hypothetical protein
VRFSPAELLGNLLEIVQTGDWRAQRRLLREAKRVFTAEGYGHFFAWKMARFALNYDGAVPAGGGVAVQKRAEDAGG